MSSLLQRIFGFERPMGPMLVKLVYWVGLVAIAGLAFGALLTGIGALMSGNLGAGAVQIIAAPAVGAAALIYWRFACELFLLKYLTYERLGEVRDLMRVAVGAPDPNHPQF